MEVTVSDAKGRLTDLVRRAEAGEDVILTRRGRPAVRLVPVSPTLTNEKKAARIAAIVADAKRKIRPGPDAEHCSDFLYDDKGLPA
ncbi:MAG TPA: type II toxin-antitoxin system prevent-host-death family antitoxin [Thalassobaculum sp.]